MTATFRNVTIVLVYAGALPFWLLMLAPKSVAGIDTEFAFLSYGAIIGAFMAGTLWGTAQNQRSDLPIIVASNVLALIAFATLLLGLSIIALVVQLTLFALLLVADFRTFAGDEEQRWYWSLRLRVTLIVGAAYGVMMVDLALSVGS